MVEFILTMELDSNVKSATMFAARSTNFINMFDRTTPNVSIARLSSKTGKSLKSIFQPALERMVSFASLDDQHETERKKFDGSNVSSAIESI